MGVVMDTLLGGATVGAGQALMNTALAPLNEYWQRRSMDYQSGKQKELTEHNARVTNVLEAQRNKSAMSELMAGAERAGVSPLTALGGTPSAVGASSAPTPTPSGPQIPPVELAAVANARLLNAQADKVEKENEDTEGYRKTLQENLPRWFRNISADTKDEAFADYLKNLADDVEANGTTKGALNAYLDTVLRLPKETAENMRDMKHAERDYKTFESQMKDENVMKALKLHAFDERVKLYKDISLINSEIALNGGKLALTSAQHKEALENARKLFAEYCRIKNSDYNTALANGEFLDFMRIMAGNASASVAGEVGPAASGLLPGGKAKAGKRLVTTFRERLTKSKDHHDRVSKKVMEWMSD